MATAEPDRYILRAGAPAARRLRLLARTMWPTTRTLLRRAGMRPGMHCLDVGCGACSVTCQLAAWAGPTGRAVGIDRDAGSLASAGVAAARRGLAVSFRAESIAELRDDGMYDLVYARFLLSHLPDPADAVQRLIRAARPGGLVAVEDVEFAAHFCYSPCPAFAAYVRLYQQTAQRLGVDPNIGPRLFSLLLAGGLTDLAVAVVQPTFTAGPGKRLALVTLEHIREAVQAAGLAALAEVNAARDELERFTRDPTTLLSLPRVFQVWGRKGQV